MLGGLFGVLKEHITSASRENQKVTDMSRVLAYTYYDDPWRMESGDDVRIHTILMTLARVSRVVVFSLSASVNDYSVGLYDGVIYVSIPRRFYKLVSKLIGWSMHYDLNPLVKLTHYVDELIIAVKLREELKKARVILVFGSMSLFSFFSRLLGVKNTILYDPLANYAQTLYLRSRGSLLSLLRYGLYLLLHKLEVKSADITIYPSKVDLENAICMFKPKKTVIISNPPPICYESIDEYMELRARRRDFNRPYFILLAGGRGRGNEEAVKVTIEVFNKLPPEKFKLMITGPWLDMKKYVKNPSIELIGVVSKEMLKELLAISDYGLSPIFSHVAGTFLKVLAYIASGLNIIASPQSLQGIDLAMYNKVVFIIKNIDEYRRAVEKALATGSQIEVTNIITCNERDDLLKQHIRGLVEHLKKYW